MKESPILVTGPLVRAILSGQKTQTRRLIRPPRGDGWAAGGEICRTKADLADPVFRWERKLTPFEAGYADIRCPYGQPGDRLWVREATRWSAALGGNDCEVEYRADNAKLRRTVVGESGYSSTRDWKLWTPSIHMPRWASRIDLEILDVRVQRIQEISEEDARAEGLPRNWTDGIPGWTPNDGWLTPIGYANAQGGKDCEDCGHIAGKPAYVLSAREALQIWWNHINGKRPGAKWEDNPWVWALTFRRVQA